MNEKTPTDLSNLSGLLIWLLRIESTPYWQYFLESDISDQNITLFGTDVSYGARLF